MNRFAISAPSMVFGRDLLENVDRLSRMLHHVEIVLFYTPALHNIPTESEVQVLNAIKTQKNLTFSVHLPASLEIAAEDAALRRGAVDRANGIIDRMAGLHPEHYVMHIPMTPPTLTAQPGCYITDGDNGRFDGWRDRALAGLAGIQGKTGLGHRLLVENINYSPNLLEPFLEQGLCGMCVDIGHLLLGNENVREVLARYLPRTDEIHLHGVEGWQEHIALDVLPQERVKAWIGCLNAFGFSGVVNLEVFDPEDLKKSLRMLETIDPFYSSKIML